MSPIKSAIEIAIIECYRAPPLDIEKPIEMPYRPIASFRKNVKGVIYPLTAAVARLFGIRGDGAYPIGAFYTVNIDSTIWRHVDGVWYRPITPNAIENRNVRDEDIILFISGITTGKDIKLRSGTIVTWESISAAEVAQLPRR